MEKVERIYVKAYRRAGKVVKGHFRRVRKKLDQSLSTRHDGVMVDTSSGNVALELDGYIYDMIDKGVDTPINILKKYGLSKEKVMYILETHKFDQKGNIIIRNKRNGDTMRIKLFDFLYGNYGYAPEDVEPLSRELVK